MIKYTMELAWKEHSVDLEAFEEWAKANCGEHYCGNSADQSLRLHFVEEPDQAVKDAIETLWEELDDEEHEMCESYVSSADREVDRQEKRDSARAKLEALGLTADELKAILG